MSMEKGGKVVWAKNNEIVMANVKTADMKEVSDGDRIPVRSFVCSLPLLPRLTHRRCLCLSDVRRCLSRSSGIRSCTRRPSSTRSTAACWSVSIR